MDENDGRRGNGEWMRAHWAVNRSAILVSRAVLRAQRAAGTLREPVSADEAREVERFTAVAYHAYANGASLLEAWEAGIADASGDDEEGVS